MGEGEASGLGADEIAREIVEKTPDVPPDVSRLVDA